MVLPEWALWVALAAMIVGLLGVILPVVPGVGLIWIVVLIYAIAEGFATIDLITFTVLTLLGAVGVTADLWMSQVGARAGGASLKALLASLGLGLLGALLGLFAFGVGAFIGGLIGAIAGIILVEYHEHKDWREAFKAGGGWLVGCTLSGGVQFVISLMMILIFTWQVLRG